MAEGRTAADSCYFPSTTSSGCSISFSFRLAINDSAILYSTWRSEFGNESMSFNFPSVLVSIWDSSSWICVGIFSPSKSSKLTARAFAIASIFAIGESCNSFS